MSACMSGTRGSGVLSSTGDVLVRGAGGVCDDKYYKSVELNIVNKNTLGLLIK